MECQNCQWWDVAEQVHGNANCRRYPPQPSWRLGQNGLDFSEGAFPVTWAQDWCGEFVQRAK